jgi:hypothetical protein
MLMVQKEKLVKTSNAQHKQTQQTCCKGFTIGRLWSKQLYFKPHHLTSNDTKTL